MLTAVFTLMFFLAGCSEKVQHPHVKTAVEAAMNRTSRGVVKVFKIVTKASHIDG